ncbi:LOW QUALITY PROTEIN: zinc finger MYND domain-containing protein 15 [Anomaloglossus baeobatrachus]
MEFVSGYHDPIMEFSELLYWYRQYMKEYAGRLDRRAGHPQREEEIKALPFSTSGWFLHVLENDSIAFRPRNTELQIQDGFYMEDALNVQDLRKYISLIRLDAETEGDTGPIAGNAGDNEGDTGTISDNEGDTGTISDNEGDTATIGDNEGDTATIGDNEGDTATIGDNEGDTATIGDNEGDTSTIGDNEGDTGTIGDNEGDTGTIGDNEDDTGTIGDNEGDTGTIGDNEGDTGTIGDNEGDTGTIGDNEGDTGTIGDNEGDTGTIGDNEGDTGTIGDKEGDTGTIGDNEGNTGRACMAQYMCKLRSYHLLFQCMALPMNNGQPQRPRTVATGVGTSHPSPLTDLLLPLPELNIQKKQSLKIHILAGQEYRNVLLFWDLAVLMPHVVLELMFVGSDLPMEEDERSFIIHKKGSEVVCSDITYPEKDRGGRGIHVHARPYHVLQVAKPDLVIVHIQMNAAPKNRARHCAW